MWQFILVFILFFILLNVVPKYKYLYILKASSLIGEGKLEEGLRLFEKAAYHKKIDFMTKLRYAFCELKYGDIKKAKKMVMWILNEKITRNVYYEAKAINALILFKEGEIEEAKEAMTTVYENYKNTNMYCTLGYLFNILETSENAVNFNKEAYEYNSDHNTILDNLGQSYYLNDEIDEAYKVYETLIEKEPAFPEAYYNFALVLIKRGENERAKEMLETALTKEFHKLTTITKEETENILHNL
ncbi:MAG: tetratricopeptide repeat protein [Clostridia bacterium]|nr:tetratricopeptide repeat protein [Clostridia bacterium]